MGAYGTRAHGRKSPQGARAEVAPGRTGSVSAAGVKIDDLQIPEGITPEAADRTGSGRTVTVSRAPLPKMPRGLSTEPGIGRAGPGTHRAGSPTDSQPERGEATHGSGKHTLNLRPKRLMPHFFQGYLIGSVNQKTLPSPTVLSTPTLPPCASAASLQNVRPRPDECTSLCCRASTCPNFSKIL